jgi:CrcB protein
MSGPPLFSIVAIGIGAAIGALMRWLLAVRFNPLWTALPVGTLLANLVGGYLIGLALGWLGQHPELPPQVRLFVVTGFLGGLTTFSTFSAEVVDHLQAGRVLPALLVAVTHVAGSLLLTALGFATARAIALS